VRPGHANMQGTARCLEARGTDTRDTDIIDAAWSKVVDSRAHVVFSCCPNNPAIDLDMVLLYRSRGLRILPGDVKLAVGDVFEGNERSWRDIETEFLY